MEFKKEDENKVYDAGQDWYCPDCDGWYRQNSEGKWEFIESQ